MDLGSEHQDLLQFLYTVPVGLVHAAANGDVELINSASARWLMPMAPDGRLDNLFDALSTAAPALRQAAAGRGVAPGVIVDHLRIEVTGGRLRSSAPEFIALTLTRLDDGRLMAVFNDVTQQVRDERALGDSAAHYRAVVSVLSEGIALHDPEGRLLMCNAAAERIVGGPLPARLGDRAMGWAPHWPDGRPMAVDDTPTGIVLGGGPAQERVSVLSLAGSGVRRWFEVSAQPVVRPGGGELLAVVTSFTDVTQRQTLQEELHHHREHLQELVTQRTRELEATNEALTSQQALLRTVADAVPGMIGYWDAELRCRFSNRAYLAWFGRDAKAMDGIRMQDLLGEELFALDRPHIDHALKGRAQHFQRTLRKADGSVGHTLASYIPDVVDGRVRGFNVVVSDVTELKLAELRLEQLNEQLRRRALQADEATKAKSAFLANMSHEIRTPMNAIVGLAHLMRRETHDPMQQSRLNKITDASQHLLRLINDVLDLSKIEAGKMTLDDTEFDTQDLLARVTGMVSAQAREKSLEIAVDCDTLPSRLRGDAVRLSQCLLNLLANAVKFTERGGIRLRGRVQSDAGPRALVRFEVEDTGPGITVDRQASLFTAFEQADSSPTRRHGGSGLGLALTRHFAHLMGGDAGVVSVPGSGSTFWFTASLGVVAGPGGTTADAGLGGLRALLIDDLPESLAAMRRSLGQLGLEVDAEPGSLQGLRTLGAAMAAGRPYDVVLVELAMQPGDGAETLARLRQQLGSGTPPCLLITHGHDAAIAQRARDAGFDGVLPKPVTVAVLAQALTAVLQPARRGPEAAAAPDSEAEARLRREHAGRRVLLVEDNPINQEVAGELLGLVGLVVETANDGAQALERLRRHRFDLVLMDVQMPVMDGLSAAREIRRGGDRTPIVAMTANAFGDERAACLAAGMDDHVAKPVDPTLLYTALLRWLTPPAGRRAGATSAAPHADADATTPSLQDRLSAVSELDLAPALRGVRGNTATLVRILVKFTEIYAPRDGAAVLQAAMGSVERLRALTHSLRGACASIGATALQRDLERFEQHLAGDPDPARHEERLRELDERLDRLVQDLRAALRP